MSVLRAALQWTVVVCLAYVVSVYGAYFAMIIYSALEERLRRRGRGFESLDRVRASTLTIPVSIIAPVYNEAPVVADSTKSFLDVDYPEFEVIVVNDGSTDDTLEVLQRTFDLEPIEHFYRRRYESGPIRGLYRSRTNPRLVVIDKVNGGKADSLNCGLNLARYRYVCGVDGDTILARASLLNGMRLALADPATDRRRHRAHRDQRRPRALARDGVRAARPAAAARVPAPRLPALVLRQPARVERLEHDAVRVGALQIWRRDMVVEIGGFSRTSRARTSRSRSGCTSTFDGWGARTRSSRSRTRSASPRDRTRCAS